MIVKCKCGFEIERIKVNSFAPVCFDCKSKKMRERYHAKKQKYEEARVKPRTTRSPRGSKLPATPRKKPKTKNSPKRLKTILWEECKRIIRARYINPNGTWNCYTCNRLIDTPAKAQTGHFIPSGSCGGFLRYDLQNLRVQDYYCNINLGGNGTEYYRRMVSELGQETVDQIFQDKNRIIKLDSAYLQKLIDEYATIKR